MEQIRRANRLFANDSLFLREFLMIPVSKESAYYPKDANEQNLVNGNFNNNNNNGYSNNHVNLRRANTYGEPSSSSSLSKDYSDSIDSLSIASPDEEHRKYMEEFLEKIDSSIQNSKKLVQQQQRNSDFISSSQSEDSLFSSSGNSFINHNYDLAHNPETSASYQQYFQSLNSHQQARHSLGNMSTDTTQLIVKSNGRHIKNSLQRLERQQEEIFEL
jgi:hypothetical protein